MEAPIGRRERGGWVNLYDPPAPTPPWLSFGDFFPVAEDFGAEPGTTAPPIDLFGNPVRLTRRGRGRPAHEATAENRQKVILWLAMGYDEERIAEAFGITSRTLAKHYFHELAYRRTARMELEAKNMAAIVEQVQKGNASAMALLDKKIEKLRLASLSGQRQSAPPKPPAVGVKEARRRAAGEVKGRFAPPDPPRLLQ